ncbi:MAG: hypothetical protein NTV49_15250 [Kiritimatiellaeota bacterium]|nr:hypothetical protein [Kiritimatiellota bacterium]
MGDESHVVLWRGPVLVLALVLLGLGLRLLAAYWACDEVHGDSSLDAVMVADIAAGKNFPTFFYGQAYMGLSEVYVSALVRRLVGGPAVVNFMGKVIFSTLFLLALFGWARAVGGRRAGLAAVAFCLIGPLHLFDLYYCAIMLQITLLLWWSVALSLRPPRVWEVLGLGLLAGFGWYTCQLMFATLLAAALLLAFAWRWRLWPWPLCAGLFGFVLGSWPWWLWNLRHDWQTFSLAGTLRGYSAAAGLQLFIRRLGELFDLPKLSAGLLLATALCFLLLLAAAAVAVAGRFRAEPRLRRHVLALGLMVVLNAYLFAISHFARTPAPRLVMPLLPVCAILVGLGAAHLTRRAPRWGWLPLLGLVAVQGLTVIPHAQRTARQNRAIRQGAGPLVEFLRRQKCTTLFGDYARFFWLNVATHGQFIVSDAAVERCAEYERLAENAPRIGGLDDFAAQLADFAPASGGAVTCTNLAGVLVAYKLAPPDQPRRVLAPDEIAGIRQQDDRDVTAALLDRDLATEWAAPLDDRLTQTLVIEFRAPVAANGVRLCSAVGHYPPLWQVERERGDGTWEAATPPLNNLMWFWSGPRIFWHGAAFRLELAFPPAPTRKLRLRFGPARRADELHFSELFVYAAAAHADRAEPEALPDLLALLRSRQTRRAYADRWLANQLQQHSAGAIAASRERAVFDRDADEPPLTRRAVPQPCPLQADTAIIVRQADAPITRATLAALRIPMRETALDPWLIFDFAPGAWQPEFGCYDNLFWTGLACLPDSQRNKSTATRLATLARTNAAERALRLWPTHQQALRILGAATPQPALPLSIRYNNGVTLSGLTLNATTRAPGQKLSLTTFWTFDRTRLDDHPVVFFHFLDAAGNLVFQDDVGLLNHIPPHAWQCPYPGELVPLQRDITVPSTVAAGRYSVRCGLVNGYTLRRYWPHTALPTRMLKTSLPLDITIAPAAR